MPIIMHKIKDGSLTFRQYAGCRESLILQITQKQITSHYLNKCIKTLTLTLRILRTKQMIFVLSVIKQMLLLKGLITNQIITTEQNPKRLKPKWNLSETIHYSGPVVLCILILLLMSHYIPTE